MDYLSFSLRIKFPKIFMNKTLVYWFVIQDLEKNNIIRGGETIVGKPKM